MESSTSSYEGTIQDSIVPFQAHSELNSVQFINELLMKIIKTVDVEELLNLFYSHLKRALPVNSLSLVSEDINLSHGKPYVYDCEISLNVMSTVHDSIVMQPTMRYKFSRCISRTENTLLTTLHDTFSHSLTHALCFSRLSRLATKDALTGLGNRASFNEDSTTIKQTSQRNRTQFGLLVIDLDNFKSVNDNFGHDEGDSVLIAFTSVLNNSLRADEKAYRFGGDEFCCLLNTNSPEIVDKVAQRIMRNAASSLLLKRHDVTVSIGGTLSTKSENIVQIFKRADRALYDVKQQGKHGYLMHEHQPMGVS